MVEKVRKAAMRNSSTGSLLVCKEEKRRKKREHDRRNMGGKKKERKENDGWREDRMTRRIKIENIKGHDGIKEGKNK